MNAAAASGGEETIASVGKYLRGKGTPGLWAITEAVKKAPSSEAKGRLLHVVGYLTPEAEAAYLIYVNARTTDPKVLAGAFRGAAQAKATNMLALISANLGHGDHEVREAAARALAVYGTPGAEKIQAAFASGEPRQMATAIMAMGYSNSVAYQGAILEALNHTDQQVVRAAVTAAGALRLDAALPRLGTIAANPDTTLAGEAVNAIMKVGGEAAGRIAVDLLGNPAASEKIRIGAAQRIAQTGHSGIGTLLEALPAATGALRDELMKAIAGGSQQEAVTRVAEVFRSPNVYQAKAAGEFLLAQGEAGRQAVFGALQADDPLTRNNLKVFFVSMGDKYNKDLVAELPKLNPHAQVLVIEILGQISATDSVAALLPYTQSSNVDVKLAAVDALLSYNLPEVLGKLAPLAQDSDGRVRKRVFQAARAMRNVGTLPVLIMGLKDPDLDTRIDAIKAIGETGAAAGLEPLQRMLFDARGFERRTLVEALARLPGAAVTAALQRIASGDPDLEVRGMAQRALKLR